jgi:hypothetical protein
LQTRKRKRKGLPLDLPRPDKKLLFLTANLANLEKQIAYTKTVVKKSQNLKKKKRKERLIQTMMLPCMLVD